jgi:hypothetical protein
MTVVARTEPNPRGSGAFPMTSSGISHCLVRAAAIGLFCLGGCGGSATAPDERPLEVVMPPQAETAPVPHFVLPAQGYDDRSFYATNPGYTEADYAEIAAMPMAMFQLRWCLSPEAVPVITHLRELNPDIVVIGVQEVLAVPHYWGNAAQPGRFPLSEELYALLIDHTLSTTLGEPVEMWEDSAMINPMWRGGINTTLLTEYLNRICHWATVHPGMIDGIMHDYTSPRPWAYPDGDATHQGEIDLDGDGVAFDDDPDEAAAWKGWQYALADELQTRFGEGFIQIANGRLPLDDPEMARRIAGVVIQKFPRTVWNFSPQTGLEYALKMREPGWLVPRRGHYWNFYWAATVQIDGPVEFRRLASFLTGDFYEVNTTLADEFHGADPDRVELGAALGPLQRVKQNENELFVREFESGTVSIEFDALGSTTAMGVSPRRAQ